jgi:2-polyprenyl-6-methoxyphenol hydroxylase-like FAD-dependent oxidoreductase
MFFIFPQGGGRARLYLNYAAETATRFSGASRVSNFLNAFDLKCVPGSEEIVTARPVGRLASFPSTSSWTDYPLANGVVLVGDEAGMTDTVLGAGLANSLWDAHQVAEILIDQSDWSPMAFRGYAAKRAERMQYTNCAAHIMSRLHVEFDEEARMRRRHAYDLMNQNPAYALFLLVTLAGPDAFPRGRFGDYLAERLLGATA